MDASSRLREAGATTGDGSMPRAQADRRAASRPSTSSRCARGISASSPSVRMFRSSSTASAAGFGGPPRPGIAVMGRGARKGSSEPGRTSQSWRGGISVAATRATSLLLATPAAPSRPSRCATSRSIRAAVSAARPKRRVVPVRSRSIWPGRTGSQTGAYRAMMSLSCRSARRTRSGSGGSRRRAGQNRRASSTGMPAVTPPCSASGETSCSKARAVCTGAIATGRPRSDGSRSRASAISSAGIWKQTI